MSSGMYTIQGWDDYGAPDSEGSRLWIGSELNSIGDIDGDGRDDFVFYTMYTGETTPPNSDYLSGRLSGVFHVVTAAALETADAKDGVEDYTIRTDYLYGLKGSYEIHGNENEDGGYIAPYAVWDVNGGRYGDVIGLGDIDGDGLDDFAISQEKAEAPGQDSGTNTGELYIIHSSSLAAADAAGGTTNGRIDMDDLVGVDGNIVIRGLDDNHRLGGNNALRLIDDVDGDGMKEIMTGAGIGYVTDTYIFNSGSMGAADLADGVADGQISVAAATYTFSKAGQATVGDYNGDGVTDYLLGDFFNGENLGVTVLLDGTKLEDFDLLDGVDDNHLDFSQVSAAALEYTFKGSTADDWLGGKVAEFVSDFGGDGLDDFLIGSRQDLFLVSSSDVLKGDSFDGATNRSISNMLNLTKVADSKSYKIQGIDPLEAFDIGDLDGDGKSDFISAKMGNAYIILSSTLEAADAYDGTNDNVISVANLSKAGSWEFYSEELYVPFAGAQPTGGSTAAGAFVGPAGDVDGDGLPDFLFSDSYAGSYDMVTGTYGGSSGTGRVYLMYGKDLAILDGFDTFGNGGELIDHRIMLGAQTAAIRCFARGSMIATDRGEVAVEELRSGDLVMTMDRGLQPIRWIGSSALSEADLEANPKLAPVTIKAGAMGHGLPHTDLRVSPQHRMLLASRIVERMTGEKEVLTPAIKLAGMDGITQSIEGGIEYFHMLFDQHEIVYSNGAPSESLYTGSDAIMALSDETRAEIYEIFPELADEAHEAYSARTFLDNNNAIERLYARLVRNDRQLIEME